MNRWPAADRETEAVEPQEGGVCGGEGGGRLGIGASRSAPPPKVLRCGRRGTAPAPVRSPVSDAGGLTIHITVFVREQAEQDLLGRKSCPPCFLVPNGGPAHGLHPRFLVAKIWADGEGVEGVEGGGKGLGV